MKSLMQSSAKQHHLVSYVISQAEAQWCWIDKLKGFGGMCRINPLGSHRLTPKRQPTIRSHSSSVSTGSRWSRNRPSTAISPSSSRPASSQRRNPSASRSLIANSRAELITRALSSLVTVQRSRLFEVFPVRNDLVEAVGCKAIDELGDVA